MEGASTAGGMIGARQRGAQRRLRHGARLQRPARAGHDARGPGAPPASRRRSRAAWSACAGRAISTAALKASAAYLAATENLARVRAA